MNQVDFQKAIQQGIPDILPEPKPYDPSLNHAPKRKDILIKRRKETGVEKCFALF